MGANWQRVSIDVPKAYGPDEREAIAQDLIDYIVERTQSGKGKGGKGFAGYSDSYIHSKEFKIAGKSAGDVNLTLTGDMLADLKLISNRAGKIIIGYENGTESNAKADGNIRGTYGKSKASGPRRDFLGLTETEIQKVLDKYSPDDKEESQARAERVNRAADISDALSNLIQTTDVSEDNG